MLCCSGLIAATPMSECLVLAEAYIDSVEQLAPSPCPKHSI